MKKQISFAALVFITLFSSCKKDDTPPAEAVTNVYVAGYQYDTIAGRDASGFWKNGTFTVNSMTGNRNHYAYAIAVSGNDAYTTGYEHTTAGWKCNVWKNGQQQYTLGTGFSLGSGIAVSGTDVYVAGFAYEPSPLTRYAMQWKNSNGTINVLAATSNITEATAIAVSGADVYVAGNLNDSGKVWKNGIALTLNNAANCYITSVAVEGNDVYAAGYTYSPYRIRYWKNGNPTDIASAGTTFTTAIAVSNGDVYIAGNDLSGPKQIAKYWKNGVAVSLGDGIRNSAANGIAVKGTDVYVAGVILDTNNSSYATIWKNGQPTTIGGAGSQAKAITVK
ncbi:hypothetical protein [Ferruginibacter sp.]|nr:hypothetical protein [Ferruginibacter sp.]